MVKNWTDFGGLLEIMGTGMEMGQVDVLNGIAMKGKSGRIFVIEKLWLVVFEIELEETLKIERVGALKPFFFDPKK